MWLPFRRARRPDDLAGRIAGLPSSELRAAVVDTELTGLDERRDSILSLGGVRVAGGRIVVGDTFYREVKPPCGLDAQSILVHGITPDRVLDLPPIGSILPAFVEFCGSDVLVGHFVAIDLAFLRKELAAVPGLALRNLVIDTWPLYEHCRLRADAAGDRELPRLPDPRLFAVARALGVAVRDGHNALGDAYLTAQVFQRLLRRAERSGMTTIGDILMAGDPERLGRHQECLIPLG